MGEYLMVKVSVIMPVYNVEKYLRQCLDSLLNQTLQEFEIICLDDGSKDASLAILQEYQQKDDRVKVLTQQNKYAGVARNNGLKIAQGEYVFFLDSDDFFEPTLFEDCYNQGKKTNADVVFFDIQKYDEQSKTYIEAPIYFGRQYLKDLEVFNRKDYPTALLLLTGQSPWTKCFKREFVVKEELEYQALQNTNDVYFCLMAMSLAERITFVDKVLVNYRIGMTTNLQSVKVKKPLCFVEALTAVYNELQKRGIYEEVKYAYMNAALLGFAHNLRQAATIDIYRQILKIMLTDEVQALDLLGHEDAVYLRKNDLRVVSEAMKVAKQLDSMSKEELQVAYNKRKCVKKSVIRFVKRIIKKVLPKSLVANFRRKNK